MADVVSETWTVQEYTCGWEPIGEPFEVQFSCPIVVEYAAELAAQRLIGREASLADWGAVDGDVRYLELRPAFGKPVLAVTQAEVKVAFTVTVWGKKE